MINAERPKLGPNAGRTARKISSARAALLPIRPGLLAHREGRKLDRHLGNLGVDGDAFISRDAEATWYGFPAGQGFS